MGECSIVQAPRSGPGREGFQRPKESNDARPANGNPRRSRANRAGPSTENPVLKVPSRPSEASERADGPHRLGLNAAGCVHGCRGGGDREGDLPRVAIRVLRGEHPRTGSTCTTPMKHTDRPQNAPEVPPEALEAMRRIQASGYGEEVRRFVEPLRGKVVESSRAGPGGFLVQFVDGTWAAAFVRGRRLRGEAGAGQVPSSLLDALEGRECGDPGAPVGSAVPYGEEGCDIAREVSNCHGQAVTGVAIGEDTFNLCFPAGMELDASIARDASGRAVLRVYWEQW
jgi:hypothetical protein